MRGTITLFRAWRRFSNPYEYFCSYDQHDELVYSSLLANSQPVRVRILVACAQRVKALVCFGAGDKYTSAGTRLVGTTSTMDRRIHLTSIVARPDRAMRAGVRCPRIGRLEGPPQSRTPT